MTGGNCATFGRRRPAAVVEAPRRLLCPGDRGERNPL